MEGEFDLSKYLRTPHPTELTDRDGSIISRVEAGDPISDLWRGTVTEPPGPIVPTARELLKRGIGVVLSDAETGLFRGSAPNSHCSFLQKSFGKIGKSILDNINAELWSGDSATTGTPTAPSPAATVPSIEEMFEHLDSIPPMPVVIWFIDREDHYCRFMHECIRLGETINMLSVYNWTASGLEARIKELCQDEHDGERYAEMIATGQMYPFREPGVWIQMNKGPHGKLEEGEIVNIETPIQGGLDSGPIAGGGGLDTSDPISGGG